MTSVLESVNRLPINILKGPPYKKVLKANRLMANTLVLSELHDIPVPDFLLMQCIVRNRVLEAEIIVATEPTISPRFFESSINTYLPPFFLNDKII